MFLFFIVYVIIQSVQPAAYDVKLEKKFYGSEEECVSAGKARVEELSSNPSVAEIVAAACAPTQVTPS